MQMRRNNVLKRRCKVCIVAGDLSNEQHCKDIVEETARQLGSLNILVNNVAQQYPRQGLEYITAEQLEKHFVLIFFLFSRYESFSHLKKGDVIINTASIVAYEGNETLIDYSATKGAIVALQDHFLNR